MADQARAGEVVHDEHLMAVLLEWWMEQELTAEEAENFNEREVALGDMTLLLDHLGSRGYEVVRRG